LVQSETNFFARHEALHDLADLAMDQRLAARNSHHRRAAFIGGVEAFLDRQAPVEESERDNRSCRSRRRQGCNGTTAPASARADSVCAQELLLEDVGADTHFLEERNSHFL